MSKQISATLVILVVCAMCLPVLTIYALRASPTEGDELIVDDGCLDDPMYPKPLEFGRDKALEHILAEQSELDLDLPEDWTVANGNPNLIGVTIRVYVAQGWKVTVRHNMNPSAAFNVEVEYAGENGFTWEGWVNQEGSVEPL